MNNNHTNDYPQKRKLPPLSALTAFEAAARHQSFSRAAEELHLTHGAISRAVGQMEERIGVSLFARRNRRVYLTVAGQRLFKTATEALDALSQTVEEIHRHDSASPFLTVSCEPSLAMRWLMPRLGAFRELHPELNIDLRMAGGPIDLLSENCDIAIRRTDFGISDDYCVTPILEEVAGPVCTPDYWNNTIGKDLEKANWLHSRTRPDAWHHWKIANDMVKVKPANEQYYDHFFYTLQAAQNQLGMAIGSQPLVHDDLKSERLIAPLGMESTGYDYALITLDSPKHDPRIAAFCDWIMGNSTIK
ncbi:LysR substrate-binding domain-containing protein [Marinomonas transparens]|uniref:LysR substrate-binding domain-containing protein n=1 Tax=Marinomonas transparens TaxID=2795388 RepID=UPI002D7F262E|nr:LysR substrate-binding domain-containing protein [Marinomonas transparens]